MFTCSICGSHSNIITVPSERRRCPYCGEGEMVLTQPLQFASQKEFIAFMSRIDRLNWQADWDNMMNYKDEREDT